MDINRILILLRVLELQVKGKRLRGWSTSRWIYQLIDIIKRRGNIWIEIEGEEICVAIVIVKTMTEEAVDSMCIVMFVQVYLTP